ncbi:MAG TPA: DNA translocase FtsK [Candidatus Ruthenibacterium merdigallinarum]|nr:DNA translocase FtsK [Candidatus Ruthenibacterium merdigallinarum]
MAKKTTTKGKNTRAGAVRGAKGAKQAPECAQEWSILLFGAAVLVLALVFVQGASAWAWVRTHVLFGVFGVSAYVLGPALVYLALRVAVGLPVRGKAVRLSVTLALISAAALLFSGTDLAGLSFPQGIAALFGAAAGKAWPLSGGVVSALFGWTLLALCGRPAANIIWLILAALWLMVLTGTTPAKLYYFLSGRASAARDRHTIYAAERADKRAAAEAERAERAQQLRARQAARRAGEFDPDTYDGAMRSRRRRAQIDIDLGEDVTESAAALHEEEKPVIGPGGTFGMFPPRERSAERSPAPVPAPAVAVEMPQPEQEAPEAAAPAPEQDEKEALASMVRRAVTASESEADAPAAPAAPASGVQQDGYAYPPLSLFAKAQPVDTQGMEKELMHNADLLVKTLESFGVKTRPLGISSGPSVTRYELQPLAGVKISRITGLADDIALNLATGGVRIEAPIPGKAAVGIEIPNKHRAVVTLRSIIESPQFAKSKDPLTFAVGKDIAGNCQVGNLAKMPHLLIAGTTGSGKSVCTNSIIMSFLYRCSPQKLRLILIDPKMVEFAQYNGIPHLLMPVVTEPRKAAGALGAAVAEMERRYHTLAENGVPNIEEYNALADADASLEKMPYIVIVIDELADLMMVAGKEVEDYICRIAQKARAAGMHLIVATQRPSVDVITGLIKANIPSRIGLTVMSQVDSRTILDTGGAEKLLGNGDMLYMPVGVNKPVRIQGTFVRSSEIKGVIDFIKKHSQADYNEEMIAEMDKCAAKEAAGGDDDGDSAFDPMFDQAVEAVIDAGQASTSLLQRRCKLGYARAARIIDELEQQHIVGPYEGSKPRKVLISRQDWIEMRMRRDGESE